MRDLSNIHKGWVRAEVIHRRRRATGRAAVRGAILPNVPQDVPRPRLLPGLTLSRDLGYDAIRAPYAAGDLVRVRAGAYAEPPPAGDEWKLQEESALRHIAAVASQLSCDVVVSHESAAMLHGCWVGRPDGRTHVTQPFKPDANDVQGVRRHPATVPEDDVVLLHGVRATSLGRTAEDCARTMHPRDGLCVADSALRILARPDRFSRDDSDRRLRRCQDELVARLEPKKGWPGVVRGRAVLAAADGWSESAGESRLRWVALSRGLPRPTCQLPVCLDDRTYFLDLGWDLDGVVTDVGARILGEEYDGVDKYHAPLGGHPAQPLLDEKTREDGLRRVGVHLRRRTSHDLVDPDALAQDMARRFPRALASTFHPVRGLMPQPSRARRS